MANWAGHKWADSLHVLQAASGKEMFQPDYRNGCEKYDESDDNERFLRLDGKGTDMYMKHCKVLIEPIAESKSKKKGRKTDKKVKLVEREEERGLEIEMIVRRMLKKEVSNLEMRYFYQSNPTTRGYRK